RRSRLCLVPSNLNVVEKYGMRKWVLEVVAGGLLLSTIAHAQKATPAEALALEQQQKWSEAAQVWMAVTARNPRDAGAFASLGVDLARQQKYKEAAASYRTALRL